jgi:hypothetical protein
MTASSAAESGSFSVRKCKTNRSGCQGDLYRAGELPDKDVTDLAVGGIVVFAAEIVIAHMLDAAGIVCALGK